MNDFREILFMGKQADPEVFARARVYDGTREPTEAERLLVREWLANRKPEPRPGGSVWVVAGGGGIRRCVCGGCLFGANLCGDSSRPSHGG